MIKPATESNEWDSSIHTDHPHAWDITYYSKNSLRNNGNLTAIGIENWNTFGKVVGSKKMFSPYYLWCMESKEMTYDDCRTRPQNGNGS